MQLQIENCGYCNARCAFCPYPDEPRKRGTMEEKLFRKVVDECSSNPSIRHVTLTGLGEPLLDPNVVDRVRYVRKRFPKSTLIDIYTNGHNLTVEKARRLMDAGLDVLYISLNAPSARHRKAIMGFDDYDKVVAVAKEAIRIGGNQMRVIVKAVMSKDLMTGIERDMMVKEWNGPWDHGGDLFLHLEGNWAGLKGQQRVPFTEACFRLFNQLMVLWDGRVSLCCFDAAGAVILGDFRTDTLREILDSEVWKKYREAHIQGNRPDLPLCGTCTSI